MEANRFNHILLQQYLDGKLDEKTMHELEKQALDDPFLADALEGYSETKMPVGKELSILQAQLAERIATQQENKNVLSFSWQRLSVAAAACLLFVLSTVLLLMKTNKDQQRLASQPKEVEATLTHPDSIFKNNSDDVAEPLPTVEKQVQNVATNTSQEKSVAKNNTYKKSSNERTAYHTPAETEISNSSLASEVADQPLKDTSYKSEVMLAKAAPAGALQELSAQRANQGLQARTPTSDEFKSKEKNLLNVRVMGYGSKARTASPVFPTGGWPSFDQYLKENLNLSGRKIKSGAVSLSFKISADGKPSDITVDKGLNKATNNEAIRVLQLGPKWHADKDSTAKVTIQFQK